MTFDVASFYFYFKLLKILILCNFGIEIQNYIKCILKDKLQRQFSRVF